MLGKTAGRWTKEEHKKFVQGKSIKLWLLNTNINNKRSHARFLSYLSYLNYLDLAIRLFGKDWRKVEDYVKTRSGA